MKQPLAPTKTSSSHATSESGHAGAKLGPFLCWAVVFADIGTSIYYVPGILFGTVNKLAGFFVLLTMLVFILLTFKYVEVTYRFPQGGGVVTVAAKALNRWFGALGGMFILVDYFLTAAISCLSGMLYLSIVIPAIGPQNMFLGFNVTLWITLLLLVLLGILNWYGVSESARVSMIAAVIAFVSDVAILISVFTHISLAQFFGLLPQMFSSHTLTPVSFLVGFAGSFLAFSGLESISQLSPVMQLPRRTVGKMALFLVVLTVGITSPLLTVLSTLLLPQAAGDNVLSSQIISLLGGKWGGPILQTEVAISASALLVFASNTAIIGSYHVFLALSRMEFFPSWILRRNRLRDTPHYSIVLATLVPIVVLLLVHGNINILGDMYAFGLLGAFTLTCLSMDIVRFRARRMRSKLARTVSDPEQREAMIAAEEFAEDKQEGLQPAYVDGKVLGSHELKGETAQVDKAQAAQQPPAEQAASEKPEPEGRWTRSTANFWLGILTTVLVVVAWSTNLIAKPLATAFGGSVSVIGMLIAYWNYAQHKKRGRTPVITTGVEQDFPSGVLALLSTNNAHNEAVIEAAVHNTDKKPVIFLFLGKGQSSPDTKPELFRLIEPHLNDEQARYVLGRANHLAEEAEVPGRFVYRLEEPGAVERIWHAVHPVETILLPEQKAVLSSITPAHTYEETTSEGKVLHMVS